MDMKKGTCKCGSKKTTCGQEGKSNTLQEFRQWLEGYMHAIDGAPTKKQWETILERLEQVTRYKNETMVPMPYPVVPVPRRRPWVYREPTIWQSPMITTGSSTDGTGIEIGKTLGTGGGARAKWMQSARV